MADNLVTEMTVEKLENWLEFRKCINTNFCNLVNSDFLLYIMETKTTVHIIYPTTSTALKHSRYFNGPSDNDDTTSTVRSKNVLPYQFLPKIKSMFLIVLHYRIDKC